MSLTLTPTTAVSDITAVTINVNESTPARFSLFGEATPTASYTLTTTELDTLKGGLPVVVSLTGLAPETTYETTIDIVGSTHITTAPSTFTTANSDAPSFASFTANQVVDSDDVLLN